MLPCVTEIRSDKEYPGRDIFFDRAKYFRFTDRFQPFMRLRSLRLGKVMVGTVFSTGHDIGLTEQARLSLLVPLAGELAVKSDKDVLRVTEGQSLFLGSGYRETRTMPQGSGHFRAVVALAPDTPALQSGSGEASSVPAGRALRDFLTYFATEFSQPDSVLHCGRPLQAAEALILDLFAELEGQYARTPASRAARSLQHVLAAEELFRAHSDEPLTVEGVAGALGISSRLLQSAFRQHRGAAPRAVLNGFRLERARERLLAAAPGVTVTDIAFDCGFAHPSRFAASYRARFGELPSATLQRAR